MKGCNHMISGSNYSVPIRWTLLILGAGGWQWWHCRPKGSPSQIQTLVQEMTFQTCSKEELHLLMLTQKGVQDPHEYQQWSSLELLLHLKHLYTWVSFLFGDALSTIKTYSLTD